MAKTKMHLSLSKFFGILEPNQLAHLRNRNEWKTNENSWGPFANID